MCTQNFLKTLLTNTKKGRYKEHHEGVAIKLEEFDGKFKKSWLLTFKRCKFKSVYMSKKEPVYLSRSLAMILSQRREQRQWHAQSGYQELLVPLHYRGNKGITRWRHRAHSALSRVTGVTVRVEIIYWPAGTKVNEATFGQSRHHTDI